MKRFFYKNELGEIINFNIVNYCLIGSKLLKYIKIARERHSKKDDAQVSSSESRKNGNGCNLVLLRVVHG